MSILRTSLREQALEVLRERLLRGSLAAGERVNETALATELKVSQTPIREALLGLEREGFVTSSPGRGFTVRPLLASEVSEFYPLLGHLEAFALRTSGKPSAVGLSELSALNADMARNLDDPEQLHELDHEWHRLLLGHVTNQRLLEIIGSLRVSVARYEHAYFRSQSRALDSNSQHHNILACLNKGDMKGAEAALERNWTDSTEPLVAWLENRES